MVTIDLRGWRAVLALGLIILVLGALLIAAIVTGTAASFEVDLFGVEVATSSVGLFFSGAAVGAGVLIGLALIRRDLRRGLRRHGAANPADSGGDAGDGTVTS